MAQRQPAAAARGPEQARKVDVGEQAVDLGQAQAAEAHLLPLRVESEGKTEVGPVHAGAIEQGPAQVQTREVDAAQVGSAEVDLAQDGAVEQRVQVEARAREIDAGEVQAAEVGATQVSAREVHAAQDVQRMAPGRYPGREVEAGQILARPIQAAQRELDLGEAGQGAVQRFQQATHRDAQVQGGAGTRAGVVVGVEVVPGGVLELEGAAQTAGLHRRFAVGQQLVQALTQAGDVAVEEVKRQLLAEVAHLAQQAQQAIGQCGVQRHIHRHGRGGDQQHTVAVFEEAVGGEDQRGGAQAVEIEAAQRGRQGQAGIEGAAGFHAQSGRGRQGVQGQAALGIGGAGLQRQGGAGLQLHRAIHDVDGGGGAEHLGRQAGRGIEVAHVGIHRHREGVDPQEAPVGEVGSIQGLEAVQTDAQGHGATQAGVDRQVRERGQGQAGLGQVGLQAIGQLRRVLEAACGIEEQLQAQLGPVVIQTGAHAEGVALHAVVELGLDAAGQRAQVAQAIQGAGVHAEQVAEEAAGFGQGGGHGVVGEPTPQHFGQREVQQRDGGPEQLVGDKALSDVAPRVDGLIHLVEQGTAQAQVAGVGLDAFQVVGARAGGGAAGAAARAVAHQTHGQGGVVEVHAVVAATAFDAAQEAVVQDDELVIALAAPQGDGLAGTGGVGEFVLLAGLVGVGHTHVLAVHREGEGAGHGRKVEHVGAARALGGVGAPVVAKGEQVVAGGALEGLIGAGGHEAVHQPVPGGAEGKQGGRGDVAGGCFERPVATPGAGACGVGGGRHVGAGER